MLLVIATSLPLWYFTRDTLPPVARIATGKPGGVFYELGSKLARRYQRATDHDLIVLQTDGSAENRRRLLAGDIDVALLQGDFVNSRHLSVIAPLYLEMVHVVVRADTGVTNINDLAGRRVILGPAGSGMRQAGLHILDHYRLRDKVTEVKDRYFTDLLDDSTIDAAIVTTGILNRDLENLARSERVRILPLHVEAIVRKHPFFYAATVPAGLYNERPPVPERDIRTVGATAYLAVRHDAGASFVNALLTALHEEGLSMDFPNLIPYHRARAMTPVPMHRAALSYFDPPNRLDFFTNILESLAAMKELIIALAAGCWLLWDRWKRLQAEERERILAAQKDHLDQYLSRTFDIESEQMRTDDPERLQECLDRVTAIKLEALRELTHEDLRSDRAFIIFLTQCANLINKIQYKILDAHLLARPARPKKSARKSTRSQRHK